MVKQRGKYSNNDGFQKDSIFMDVASFESDYDFLKKILVSISKDYRVNIVSTNDLSYLMDIVSCDNLFIVDKQSSEVYRECMKSSQYIFIDKCLPKSFSLQKHQKVFYIVNELKEDEYQSVQRTLQLSTYIFFNLEEDATKYLTMYGMNNIFKGKSVVYHNYEGIFNFLLSDNTSNIQVIDSTAKPNILICIDPLKNKYQESLVVEYLNQLDDEPQYFILSPGLENFSLIKKSKKNNLQYLSYKRSHFSFKEKMILALTINFKLIDIIFKNHTHTFLKREMDKKIKGYHFSQIIYLFDTNKYSCREINTLKCDKYYGIISDAYVGLVGLKHWYKSNLDFKKKNYNTSILIDKQVHSLDNEDIYNSCVDFYRLFSFVSKKGCSVKFSFYFSNKSVINIDYSLCQLYLGDKKISSVIKKGLICDKMIFTLNSDNLTSLPTQNKFFLSYLDKNNYGFKKDIKYRKKTSKKLSFLKSRIISVDGKTSCYLRQSQKNRLYLTVRHFNRTDSFLENFRINIAYCLSFVIRKKIYLLFEKDSSRYEESASVLYENLIDKGYNNAFFILDKNYSGYNSIELKYRQNIIRKYSFKHYLYFFVSQTFFGSELLVHSMELRIMNKHVLKKIYSDKINYVFLQHGVMYMVSLDSESRKYFTPRKDGKGKYRVVTSSNEEARHFIELGGYDAKQLIVCGLPKYDRNVLNSHASKIVIMPTWRPWEYNIATTNFKQTKYYQMIERIVNTIADKYQDEIIVLPHPLFYEAAKDNDFELKKYMLLNCKYDEILRDTRILITDYSSIAYDAFYRGSRVIFYWEELTESLENYGSRTKLMLNKDNAFGDICYDSNDLSKVLDNNYDNFQREEYIEKYNRLVEFHDGKNTERLIKYLESENIL